jgi:hypothetical protein
LQTCFLNYPNPPASTLTEKWFSFPGKERGEERYQSDREIKKGNKKIKETKETVMTVEVRE